MKTASCKAKGRRLQNKLAADLREALGFSEADIKPALMSENGMDLKLSEAARKAFPFAVEAKSRESLPLWASISQAEENAESEGLRPLLAFKRNGSEIHVVLKWNDFLELVGKAKEATA
jgi:hypothetical protein